MSRRQRDTEWERVIKIEQRIKTIYKQQKPISNEYEYLYCAMCIIWTQYGQRFVNVQSMAMSISMGSPEVEGLKILVKVYIWDGSRTLENGIN